MKIAEAKNNIERVNDLNDFINLFPNDSFEIVYKTNDNKYTDSVNAKIYDSNNSCVNSYMKFEDGFLKYPF